MFVQRQSYQADIYRKNNTYTSCVFNGFKYIKILGLLYICLHDKMLKFYKKRIFVSHRHATKANALIGDNNVFYFQTMIVFRKYIVIDCKNCNFAIENEIFDCRKFTFASFFKNLESGSPGLPVGYVHCTSLLNKLTNLNTD